MHEADKQRAAATGVVAKVRVAARARVAVGELRAGVGELRAGVVRERVAPKAKEAVGPCVTIRVPARRCWGCCKSARRRPRPRTEAEPRPRVRPPTKS